MERFCVEVGRRMHVMASGAGPTVLLVHGNPTWGFLYRNVVAELGLGFHCVVPDLIGMGLSEKPGYDEHTLLLHQQRLAALIDTLDLRDVVLVVQDWGGAVGVGAMLEQPERLGGLVVLNTVLGPPKVGFKPTMFHRSARWPVVSDLLFRGLSFPQRWIHVAQGDRRSIRGDVAKAYRWPLRDRRTNIGPLALTRMVPDGQTHPSIPALQRVQQFVEAWEGPARIVWGDADPILGRLKSRHSRMLPQADVVSTPAGHFLQEEVPELIAEAIRQASRTSTK
jgi:cis-3-alkyl-4-acyloxetan-2-one decarboxylase